MKYVGVVIQGSGVLDSKAVSTGDDEQTVLQAAEGEAKQLNDKQQGMAFGYSAIVLELPEDASS